MPDAHRRPNLLLITSDQQHFSTLGFRNPAISTPNLDRLAAMGVDFPRAYCPNPTCTPTRATILTGQYPSAHGAFTLGTRLDESVPTLGDLLRPLGYTSTLVGKAHFQPLAATEDSPSVEAYPTLRDLGFWRSFNQERTPWYGFDRVEITRNHADEGHVGQHYALWLEEQGFAEWREFFQPRNDGVRHGDRDAARAPKKGEGLGYGWREDRAWDLPEHLHYTAWTGQRSIAAIEAAHEAGEPFFLWSSYHDPHPPYTVPEPWASMYDPADMQVGHAVEGEMDDMPPPHRATRRDRADWDPGVVARDAEGFVIHGQHDHRVGSERQLQEAQATYYGMISFMDHWIGRTLDRLEELGELGNTLVVFTSDHGHFLGQHGLIAKGPFHYEDLIRVPMLACFGDRLPAGTTSAEVQSLVDLAPTFLEAAGLERTPRSMQGLGRLAEWTGEAPPPRDHAIVENHHSDGPEVHLRTLVTRRYKLTVHRGRPWGELFDLEEDPGELHNLFDDPGHAALRSEMMERLVQADLAREPAPRPRVSAA